jgi:D-aminopeptidase
MTRLRDLGVTPGRLPAGPENAITDVPGVRVGHVTLTMGDGPLVPGQGPVRTGVTAIVPHSGDLFQEPVAGAVHTINGFGKVVGFEQVREIGTVEAPILLTNTMNVGLVADALGTYMMRDHPNLGLRGGALNRVVGETNDGFLNDLRGRHVREEHVWQAIETAAGGPVAEGNVGAGTGTIGFGFKAGIGTASRQVFEGTMRVGALVQTNCGSRPLLRVMGAPIGEHFMDRLLPGQAPSSSDPTPGEGSGSIMIVIATDAPASSRLLERMAKRATFGLGRVGGIGEDSSGDFVIAFSTTNRRPQLTHEPPRPPIVQVSRVSEDTSTVSQLFLAVVEAVEEAILNSLVAAETMVGRDHHIAYALPHHEVADLLARYGRG